MNKVIIKVNIFMENKEFTNVCNFIYNQYKERNIVIVPPYCDVYVVDGEPEIKVEKSVEKNCRTCKHSDRFPACPGCGKNFNEWEAKDE